MKSKNFQTELYSLQKKVALFVKMHRTIRLLNLFRKYSALAVVVSSAMLVTATNNVASGGQAGNFLSGQWRNGNRNEVRGGKY
ncbi:MAG: hypothetical protein UR83_C0016G0003 [Candidatus Moranbacteria bacterium GW2011_GWF2_35_54]|nr:MAG: hypothetical protein UR83_C0016G0003 [Candidatus Moranbacteria bacterium GW2011_GWF2_35_54]